MILYTLPGSSSLGGPRAMPTELIYPPEIKTLPTRRWGWAMTKLDRDELKKLADRIDTSYDRVAGTPELQGVAGDVDTLKRVVKRLLQMLSEGDT